ncbi:MAG: MBL fold metallo-hydrolase [Desulfurobacteriaceae bacterium]
MENLFIPVGGGNEIGASCYLYIVGGTKVIIDSGIRFDREPFPDFDLLKSIAPKVDAILVTHAHIDHCGSIHVLSNLYPEAPIYATNETVQLLSLMVEDAIKVRHIKERNSPQEWKEYKLLDEALTKVERREFFDSIKVGDIEIQFLPSGHIMGASSIKISYGDSSSLFHTGDISLSPQRTVDRAEIPDESVDFLVSESTYLSSSRKKSREEAEEEFFSSLRKVFEKKGKVLIPVFALGRAQEIISLMTEGMKEGKIPPVTVYVDGLAREVTNIYENLLRRKLFNFYVQPAPTYEGISFEEACEENLREADCIIATSGMLMEGTPSYIYAKLLSKDPRSAILFSGYLVEESFGYRLLREKELLKSFKCKIESHHFSAHSDRNELLSIVEKLSPRKNVFIHGFPGENFKDHAFNREVIRF